MAKVVDLIIIPRELHKSMAISIYNMKYITFKVNFFAIISIMGISTRVIGERAEIGLSIDAIKTGTRLPFDVYVKDKGILKQVFNKGTIYTNFAKDTLKAKGINEIYIHKTDQKALEIYKAKKESPKDSVLDNPVLFKNYSFVKDTHHQIDKSLMLPGTEVPFSIFLMNKFDQKTIIEATEQSPSVLPDIRLVEGDLVIKKSDIDLYEQYINSLFHASTATGVEKSKFKSVALRESSKILMKKLLDDPRSGEAIKQSQKAVNNMIDNILENKESIYDMLSLRNYDYYTYTHSVNVAVLAIGLAVELGLKRSEVENLGAGAMLHDIGKSTIPHEVLNKQGKLDNIEYRIIQNHVIEGEKIIKERKDIHEDSIIPLIQHHEKLTGKGYPHKLSGKDIKLFGRITAIADCYDALTTQRPYKPAFTPFYALQIIAKDTGDYDPELLRLFIKMLGKIK